MPGKDRTLIPRSSPPKSNLKGAGAPTSIPTSTSTSLHLNAPIPLRGTGKPASRSPSIPSPARPIPQPHANLQNGASLPSASGSRIPGPFRGRTGTGLGIGSALPAPAPKAVPTAPVRGHFHMPVIHSPATKFTPMSAQTSRGPANTRPVDVESTEPAHASHAFVEEPQAIDADDSHMLRMSTTTSSTSSASKYTTQSATESQHEEAMIEDKGENGSRNGVKDEDDDGDGDEEREADTEGNGIDEESEDVVLSPGFDTIQALARNTNVVNASSSQPFRAPRPVSGEIPAASHTTPSVTIPRQGSEEVIKEIGDGGGNDGEMNEGNGVDDESEDIVLSPGFDVIQALATNSDIGRRPTRSKTDPRPLSRNISGTRPAPSYTLPPRFSPSTPNTQPNADINISTDMRNNLSPATPKSTAATPIQRTPTQRTPKSPRSLSSVPTILRELETLLGHPCVHLNTVVDAHREAEPSHEHDSEPGPVFGIPLNVMTRYASCSSVLGGQSHTLPLVVFACVEELYRAGLRSPRLLRPPPHPTSASKVASSSTSPPMPSDSFPVLIASFNSPPTYGDDIDLATEEVSLDDVGALLMTYLGCLPGGVMPTWVRGVLVEVMDVAQRDSGLEGHDTIRGLVGRERAIRAAQLILRLLPPVQFSLLVYLLAFLSQVPLYEAWNGWSARSVARAFARIIVGVGDGGERDAAKTKGKNKEMEMDWVAEEEDAVEALEWLLASWDDISEGLFVGGANASRAGERDREREAHRAAAMRHLDPARSERRRSDYPGDINPHQNPHPHPHHPYSSSYSHPQPHRTSPVSTQPHSAPNTSHTPATASLRARIASLELANTEWQWLQTQHEAQLQAIFEEGERRIGLAERAVEEVEEALATERAARVQAEQALATASKSTHEAVLAERRRWVGEVQALREGWERMGSVWESVGKEYVGVDRVVHGIIGRVVEGAPGARRSG